jgi:BirA family biotin operon repressor/biotin-[acetyl-CoA-carboxylase] ligase
MATPYFQFRFDTVPSTQDIARERIDDLPVLVQATGQSEGRGRTGSEWINADRALAASLAIKLPESDQRPFSLMAGVAAVRATDDGASLKWPNDVMVGDLKVGGILVERSGEVVVIGLGLNLWWPDPPTGAGGLYEEDPGPERHAEIGGLWGAELMRLLDAEGWPSSEYKSDCVTLGRQISWEPGGSGRAVDVAPDGGLIVETSDGATATLYSGRVSHVR